MNAALCHLPRTAVGLAPEGDGGRLPTRGTKIQPGSDGIPPPRPGGWVLKLESTTPCVV